MPVPVSSGHLVSARAVRQSFKGTNFFLSPSDPEKFPLLNPPAAQVQQGCVCVVRRPLSPPARRLALRHRRDAKTRVRCSRVGRSVGHGDLRPAEASAAEVIRRG